MNKTYLFLIIIILLTSCENQKKNSNEVDKKTITQTKTKEPETNPNLDKDFEIVSFSDKSGFIENIKGINGDGPSLKLIFSVKNNTKNKIVKFDFSRFAKTTLQDGKVEYFPRKDILDLIVDDDNKRMEHSVSKFDIMKKGEIWKPNEIKEFTLIIPHIDGFGNKLNFNKNKFNRTPEQFIFAYKYYAISVDNEYSKLQYFDMLPFWKKYQRNIGLR